MHAARAQRPDRHGHACHPHALHPLQARVHTLTWDDGSEFAEHALVDIALTAKSCFVAYSSR